MEPRVRRPVDVAAAATAAVALAVLLAIAATQSRVLRSSARLLPTAAAGVPHVVLSVLNAAASLSVLGVLVLVAVDAARARRLALAPMLVASALGAVAGAALTYLVDLRAGAAAGELLREGGLPLTAAVSLLVGADLMHRRIAGPAAWAVAASVACAVAVGGLSLPGAVYSLTVGAAAGLAVRAAVGVAPARPTDDVVLEVLARAGWTLQGLQLEDRVAGRARYVGAAADTTLVRVTVDDPDRRGVPFLHRVGRLLGLRASAVGRPALSVRGQLERHALSGALAEAAGVPAPQVVALLPAGRAFVLVERPLPGIPLPAADPPVRRACAEAAFASLRRLHDAGIAHGAVTADGALLLPDGRVGFADLDAAQPAATELQRDLDLVAMLVAMSGLVGPAEAVRALEAAYRRGAEEHGRLLALLQPLALPVPSRRAVRGTPVLQDLRQAVRGSEGTEAATDLERLQRLRPRTVLTVVGGAVAAYVLVGQLSTVDVAGSLRSARIGWVAVAVAGSAVTYVGAALTLRPFVPRPLPLLRTTLVQLASSFLALVTPPAVGHVGLNIRYLDRAGVPTATAAACVALKEGTTVAVTVVGLLVCGWLSGVSGSRLSLLPSGEVLAVLGAAALVLAVAALLPPVRRQLHRRVEPIVRGVLTQLVSVVTHPRRLAAASTGVLLLNAGYVVALDAALRAFSVAVAVTTLVVVYLAASAIGSAAPTPGGLGAVEAALVGGLSAVGVPVAEGVAGVLVFRAATFWLPAPLGWLALLALQRRGRV